MKVINVEIKALCSDHERIRRILLEKNADFIGMDHQVDTYFEETLDSQCRQLMDELGVRADDLVSDSYSDILMAKT